MELPGLPVSIPLIRLSGRSVRANLTLDEGVVRGERSSTAKLDREA